MNRLTEFVKFDPILSISWSIIVSKFNVKKFVVYKIHVSYCILVNNRVFVVHIIAW